MSPLRINLNSRNIPQFHTRSDFHAIENTRFQLRIPSHAVPVRHTPSRSIEWRPAENDALWQAFPGPVRIWSMPQSMVIPEGEDGGVKPGLIVKSVSQNEQGVTEETIAYGFNNETSLPLRWKSGTLLRLRVKQSVHSLAEAGNAPWWQGKIHSFLGVRESDIVLLERLLKLGREALNGSGLHARLLYRSGSDDSLQAVNGSPLLFVLQENLSSDTNPAAELVLAREMGTGLVGDMHLFISKLWEGSITRAGGYRLFAGNGEDAQGKLPDDLFDDNGEAELQLLLVGSDSKAHAYLNCLITGGLPAAGPGRSMYAEWEREELPIEQLGENSSFADIMDRYLGDWNEFAATHAEQPLKVGETLTIEGGIDVIWPQVLDTVEKIVRKYGNSFSAEELKSLNKHIPPDGWTRLVGGTYFHIPRTTHEVKKAEENRHLKKIAKLYNVSVASLIWSNQDKLLNLFANNKEIRLRTGPIHRLPALPEGAIELIAERDASADDAQPTDEENLEELFHLLSYRILPNDRFEAHVPALPIGPTETADHQALPGQADGTNSSAPQAPLHYTKAIPYARFLKKMTEPEEFAAYRGIGSVLQMRYDWMDVFGNRLVRDSEKPENLRNLLTPVSIGFTDELLGPQQWPTIASDYEIVSVQGQPMIRIRFTRDISYLKSSPTAETRKQTEAQAERLNRAAGQLEHQMKGIETVYSFIRTSLMPLTFLEPILLTAADRNNLITFLKETAELQTAWANGGLNHLPASLLSEKPLFLDLGIDLEQIAEQDVFELTVSLEFVRKRDSVDPEFRFTPAFWHQAANILPARSSNASSNGANGVDPALSLRNFASQLEAALNKKGGPRYRTAVGLDRRRWIERAAEVPIWLVRAAAPDSIDGAGIQFSIPAHPGKSQEPVIYAPSPLINADTLLPYKQQYNTSEKVTGPILDVSTIDMERQARFFLDTFEQILASEAMAAFELLPPPRPGEKRFSEQLMEYKDQLAKIISGQLIKVYEAIQEDDSSSTAEEMLDSAREVYRQKLLHSLSKTYFLDAIAQFRVYLSGKTNKSGNGQKNKPRLYGTIQTAEPLPAGLTLPPCKIDIAPKGVADSYSLLNISFVGTLEDPAAITPKPYVQVDGYYNPTHIEHQIEPLPEIPEFKASSWLYFILPDSQQLDLTFLDRPLGSFQVPLALRSYPEIPALAGQALNDPVADRTMHGAEAPLEEHLKWDYEFTYSRTRHLPQDRVRVEVVFRENMRGHLESDEDLQHLCGALKDYQDYYPELIKSVKNATNVGSIASEEAKHAIHNAAQALIDIVKFITENWEKWDKFKSRLPVTSTDLQPKPASAGRHEYRFYIEELEGEDGAWNVRLTETSPNPSADAPLVEIAGYQCIPADKPVFLEGGKLCRYEFTYTDTSGAPLRADAGLTALKRKVKLPGLNILREPSAWTSIAITRNEELVEGKRTAAPFIYRTDKNRFEHAYLPSLRRNYPIAMTDDDQSDRQPLGDHLNRFINRIFRDVAISDSFGIYYLQAECMYSYRLANQLFSIAVPVLLMPRKSLADMREAVDAIAKQVETFFATRRPETNGGQFHFDLSVLKDQNDVTSTAPFTLLRLTDVVLDLDQVKLNG